MDAELFGHTVAFWLAVGLVGVIGTARLVRLLVFDTYPPSVWARVTWDRITRDGPWSTLVHCGYCAAPWITVISIAWAWWSDFHWTWWLFYGWLTISYLAAIIVSYDEPVGPEG